MNKTKEQFDRLLSKYLDKSSSLDELKELLSYVDDAEYKDQLGKVMAEHFNMPNPTFNDGDVDWEEMLNSITRKEVRKAKPLWTKILSVAAVLLAILSIGILIRQTSQHSVVQPSSTVTTKKDLAPGGNKAILKLADGREIILDGRDTGILAREGGTQISTTADGMIIYDASKTTGGRNAEIAQSRINTLITPEGGQYMLILPDNSKVWLNSGSSLSYPSVFNEAYRQVELKGEAYFEIAKDKQHPFKVKVGAAEVSVLGTHFNVMSYQNENSTQISLAEGSVQVEIGLNKQLLKPGQQALIMAGAEKITLRNIDLEEATSWKNGSFQFDNTPIDQVMRQIARWYAVDVIYEGTKPKFSFTGMISRDNNVSKILKMIEETGGIDFEIRDKEIIVKTSKRR